MNILVDENIPRSTASGLRAMGHMVIDIRGTVEEGIDDRILWQKAQEEQALLITTDKGFAQHRHEMHSGILIVCLRQPNRLKIHERVIHAMTRYTEAEWPGLIVVMRDRTQSMMRFLD